MDLRPGLEERLELLLKPHEAARLLGVTERCLRRWVQEGRIRAVRTPGGHYRYPLDSVLQIIGSSPQPSPERTAALYARASCRREIERQLDVLRRAADAMGYAALYEDYDLRGGDRIGEGLQRLILLGRRGLFRALMVTSYSRVSWLGVVDPRFLHLMFMLMGVPLVVVNPSREFGSPAELLLDFIEIHERMAESLQPEARKMNREILQALRILQRRYRIRWEEE
ncbi:IS607 family transposase [Thermoflexus hugenholtzii]